MSLEDKILKFLDKKGISLSDAGELDATEVATDVCSIMQKCIIEAANSAPSPGVPQSVYEELGGVSVSGYGIAGSDKDGTVLVEVDLDIPTGTRPSLDPNNQEGVNDIVALINNGFMVKSRLPNGKPARVRGKWKDHTIKSATSRPPTNFLANAIERFRFEASGYKNPIAMLDSKYRGDFSST